MLNDFTRNASRQMFVINSPAPHLPGLKDYNPALLINVKIGLVKCL